MSLPCFDTAVFGAGPAGLSAALQCAREGLHTVLIEKNGIPGGAVTLSSVTYPGLFHAWGRQVIAGIGWELVRKTLEESNTPLPDFTVPTRGRNDGQVRINGFLFSVVADRELLAAGVDIRYHTMAGAARQEGGLWKLTLCGKDGLYEIHSRTVIDCTGDANIVHMAGFPCNEPEVCQPGSMSVHASGYDLKNLDEALIRKRYADASAKGEVSPDDFGWSKDFSMSFLRHAGNNANHVCRINAADSPRKTLMEIEGRRTAYRQYRFFRSCPGLENLTFEVNSAECGVRESRTIVGETTVTADDYRNGRAYPDSVCYSVYPIDLHDTEKGLVFEPLNPNILPQVPRGALIPKGAKGLFAAGRILSSDRLANSALRVQATAMATGQAAGALAVLSLRLGADAMNIPVNDLHELLRKHAAIIPD